MPLYSKKSGVLYLDVLMLLTEEGPFTSGTCPYMEGAHLLGGFTFAHTDNIPLPLCKHPFCDMCPLGGCIRGASVRR